MNNNSKKGIKGAAKGKDKHVQNKGNSSTIVNPNHVK